MKTNWEKRRQRWKQFNERKHTMSCRAKFVVTAVDQANPTFETNGELSFSITNPNLIGTFKVGAIYYLDFTETID
jgi:hypothetical protein